MSDTTHTSTLELVNQQIADMFGFEADELHPDDDLRKDLNATDLEFADLLSTLEHQLGVEISMDEARQLVTLGDLHELLLDKLNEVL